MAKPYKSSTDKDYMDIGDAIQSDDIMDKKPNWVNLAQLDGPMEDSLLNRFLYKPALRFHGLAGGLWGQGLSNTPSVMSESRPPSYKSRLHGDEGSTGDIDSIYAKNIPARSPLALRRRNTIAVILVAIGLLASVAAITGVILHFLHPKEMLRAHVRFTIANFNFTDDMGNITSVDFNEIARPLCVEMDVYYLTSELADFYLGCKVISLSNDTSKPKNGTAVHFTLDFTENKVTNDRDRIKKVILRKSGRLKTEDALYLVVRDFLVYLRSLRVDLEVMSLPDGHPGRTHSPARIPWDENLDFISRKSGGTNISEHNDEIQIETNRLTNNLTDNVIHIISNLTTAPIPRIVLPEGEQNGLPIITVTALHPSVVSQQQIHALHLSGFDYNKHLLPNVRQSVFIPEAFSVRYKNSVVQGGGWFIAPSKSSIFVNETLPKSELNNNNYTLENEIKIVNEKKAEKIETDNLNKNYQGMLKTVPIHNVFNSDSSILHNIHSSFNDVNDNKDIKFQITETISLPQVIKNTQRDDNRGKIFTIFTDVFLIVGSDSTQTSLSSSTVPVFGSATSFVIDTLDDIIPMEPLNEFIGNDFYVEKMPEALDLVPEIQTSFVLPDLMTMKTIMVDINMIKAPKLMPKSEIVKPTRVAERYSIHKRPGEAEHLPVLSIDSNVIKMKEVVENIPRQEFNAKPHDRIAWINIFDTPHRTVPVQVDELPRTVPVDADVPHQKLPVDVDVPHRTVPVGVDVPHRTVPDDVDVPHRKLPVHVDVPHRTVPVDVDVAHRKLPIHVDVNHRKLPVHVDVPHRKLPDHFDFPRLIVPVHVDVNHRKLPVHVDEPHRKLPVHVDVRHLTVPVQDDVSHRKHPVEKIYPFSFQKFNLLNSNIHSLDANSQVIKTSNSDISNNIIMKNAMNNEERSSFRTHPSFQRNGFEDRFRKDNPNEMHKNNWSGYYEPLQDRRIDNWSGYYEPLQDRRIDNWNGYYEPLQDRRIDKWNGYYEPLQDRQIDKWSSPLQDRRLISNRLEFNNLSFDGNILRAPSTQYPSHHSNAKISHAERKRNNMDNDQPFFNDRSFGITLIERIPSVENGYGLFQRKFITQNGFFNGKRALFLTNFRQNHPKGSNLFVRHTENTMSEEPWKFLRSIGVKVTDIEQDNNLYNIPFEINRISGMPQSQGRFEGRLSQQPKGFPKSRDFKDIADMKEILRQLVDNMYNMTAKLDNMQNAIDFINKTFHETREPLLNLEETLNNMSISLENLNNNLNNINQTLQNFKDFLRQFGNTVFNIDDVIRNIDKTVGNLGKAVDFVKYSVNDINSTANGIADNLVDINNTLKFVNKGVIDLDNTSTYSNKTLDSMKDTLDSLEKAIGSLSDKINNVSDGSTVFNVSLKNINYTVKNTYTKLGRLHGKLMNFNSSMNSLDNQVQRLNDTYRKINKSLEQMNEPYIFTNGTILEVIQKLALMDEQIQNLRTNTSIINSNLTSMNSSLSDSMDWMKGMVKTLTDFNIWIQENNNTIEVNVKNKDFIQTVGTLLQMNGTLTEIGYNLDDINEELDIVEVAIVKLESNLAGLDNTLESIDSAFMLLNKTIDNMNITLTDANSSMKVVTSTIQAMELTFDEIKLNFGNINTTLGNVNKANKIINNTLMEINGTLLGVNNTLKDLSVTVNSTLHDASRLTNTVLNLNGSVSELNLQLYNANESMRITNSKADIAKESHRVLNKTLSEIENTFTDMLKRLEETNSTLISTNSSLNFANDSLMVLQDSFQKISTQLSDLQDSLLKMNMSMSEFDTAFPNIKISIHGTRTALVDSKAQIENIGARLLNHTDTRDGLVRTYESLLEAHSTIAQKIPDLKHFLKHVQNMSDDIFSNIQGMDSSVTKASDLYKRAEKNIDHINKTHNKLYNKFNQLTDRNIKISENMKKVKKDLENSELILDKHEQILKNYTLIDEDTGMLRSDIMNQFQLHQAVDVSSSNWNTVVKKSGTELWTENGYPSNVHDDYDKLVNKTEAVNKTLGEYESFLDASTVELDSIFQFNEKVTTRFKNLDMLRGKIDNYERLQGRVGKQTLKTSDALKSSHSNLITLSNSITDKLGDLEHLKDSFGDINGTFNSSHQFQELEDILTKALLNVQQMIDSLNTTADGFEKVINNFRDENETFYNRSYNLSPDSFSMLDKSISLSEDTLLQIIKTNNEIAETDKNSGALSDQLGDILSKFYSLENTLANKNQKNNFVTSNEKKFEKKFEQSNRTINQTFSLQDNLLERLKALRNTSNLVEKSIGEIQNTNISIKNEIAIIDGLFDDLEQLQTNYRTAKDLVDTVNNRFISFDEDSVSLDEVKKEYGTYESAINRYDDLMQNMSSTQSDLLSSINTTSEVLNAILIQLVDLINLKQPLKLAKKSLEEIDSKSANTLKFIQKVAEELHLLREKFELLQVNYTNFTATEINLSESYVNEALVALDESLFNLTSNYEEANNTFGKVLELFKDTEKTYTEKIFDRTNIYPTINNVIQPNINEITATSDHLNSTLDHLNESIWKLKHSVNVVNETIHSTNKQLFEDKQKELLSNAKLPVLQDFTELVLASIQSALNSQQNCKENINVTTQLLNQLQAKMQTFPFVNISTDETESKLNNKTNTLNTINEKLLVSLATLKNINETLWVENGKRYSNDETIEDIKSRYQKAENNLQDLLAYVKTIETDIGRMVNETKESEIEISDTDYLLDQLYTSENLLDKTNQNVSDTDMKVNTTKQSIFDLKDESNNIMKRLEIIKHRFSTINKTVFDDQVDQFEKYRKNHVEKLQGLEEVFRNIESNISQVYILQEQADDLRKEMSSNNQMIEKKVNKNTETHKASSSLLEKINKDLEVFEKAFNNISMKELSARLQDIERKFIDQEKLEYYQSNYPENEYKQLNLSLWYSFSDTESLLEKLSLVQAILSGVEANVSKHENLAFDTHSIKLALAGINNTLTENMKSIQRSISKHKQLETLLFTPEGKLFSESETLGEMQGRYTEMNDGMRDIEKALANIKQIEAQQHGLLDEKQFDIDLIDTSTMSFETTEKILKASDKEINRWNILATERKQTSDFLRKWNSEESELYDKLVSEFAGTTSKDINDLKSEIEGHISSIRNKLPPLEMLASNFTGNVSKLETFMQIFKNDLYRKHKDPQELLTILSKYVQFKESFDNTTKEFYESNNTANALSSDILNESQVVETKLQHLNNLLLSKAKQDYLQVNVPILQNILQKTNASVNQVFDELDDVSDKTEIVNRLFEEVHNATSVIPSISIPTNSIKESIDIILNRTGKLTEIAENTEQTLMNIDERILDEKGSFFPENETLETIKDIFEKLNSTLRNVETESSALKKQLNDDAETLKLHDSFLRHFQHNLTTYDELRREIKSSEQLQLNVSQAHTHSGESLKQSRDKFSDISDKLLNTIQKYKDVKDNDVQQEAAVLRNQLTLLNSSYVSIHDNVIQNENNLASLQNVTNLLRTKVDQVSYSLADLGDKIVEIKPMKDLVVEDLFTANMSVFDVIDLIENNMDNLTKLEKRVDDLGEKMKRQQIVEYIKDNFPSLLEEFKDVNMSLGYIDSKIPITYANLNALCEKIVSLDNKIKNISIAEISTDDLKLNCLPQNDTMNNIIKDGANFRAIFTDLENVISNNFHSNETIDDIITRFAGYEKTLQELNFNITALNISINEIDRNVDDTSSRVNEQEKSLEEFHKNNLDILQVKNNLKTLSMKINQTENNLKDIENNIYSNMDDIGEMMRRFEHIESKDLHDQQLKLKEEITNFLDEVTQTKKYLNGSNYELDTQYDKFKLMEDMFLTPFKNFSKLNEMNTYANTTLRDVFPGLKTIDDDIENTLLKTIPQLKDRENAIKNRLEKLKMDLLEKEKQDVILDIIPELEKQYKAVNKSIYKNANTLNESKQSKQELDVSINFVQDRIKNRVNVQFSTDAMQDKINELQSESTNAKTTHDKSKHLFNNLDISIFSIANWSHYATEDLNKTFQNFRNNISILTAVVTNASNHLQEIKSNITDMLNDLNHTHVVLDKYEHFVNISSETEKDLATLVGNVNETDDLLENVKEQFYINKDRLINLQKQFHNNTNMDIEKVINETRTILESIGFKVPAVNNMFIDDVKKNLSSVIDNKSDVTLIIQSNYTSKNNLENELKAIEAPLNYITKEVKKLIDTEETYHDDAKNLSSLLHNSSILLDKLEDLFQKEAKLDILRSNLPKLKEQWNAVNKSTNELFADIANKRERSKEIKSFAEDIDWKLKNISTVNISTMEIHEKIENIGKFVGVADAEVDRQQEAMFGIEIHKIDINSIVNDENVSVEYVRRHISELKESLSVISENQTILNRQLDISERNISTTNESIFELKKLLSDFDKARAGIQRLNESLIATKNRSNIASSKLHEANLDLDTYKSALKSLKEQYSDLKFNSNDIETLLSVNENDLSNANRTLSTANDLLTESETEHVVIVKHLYKQIDDQDVLNETIGYINNNLTITVDKLQRVNAALDKIFQSIPNLTIQLSDLKEMIKIMNETLQNEHSKSTFAEKALSIMKNKYKLTNLTFELTNNTLKRLSNEIIALNNYVETLKNRMNHFSNIDIPLLDIDANITHLENRLIIMQDHYNNVKEIVDQFKRDLSNNNIFGENISLADVEDKYKDFNGTLDMINEVLGKIGEEAVQMSDHFLFLNDTMTGIDEALDRFEEKQMNTKAMKTDIDKLAKQLSDSNDTISELQRTSEGFVDSFNNMQSLYADVLNITTENNTRVNDMLSNTKQLLDNFKEEFKNLNQLFSDKLSDFNKMNETLNGDVKSFDELNRTVESVKKQYVELRKSLLKIESDITKLHSNLPGAGSTLTDLDSLLDSINTTLSQEKEKFDYIKSHLGHLESKLRSLKNPINSTTVSLNDVSAKVENSSKMFETVSRKLKSFSNVKIPLTNDSIKLEEMKNDILLTKVRLANAQDVYDILHSNFTSLDDQTGNMSNIRAKYDHVNETLDTLQNNLTDMLLALDNIGLESEQISEKTKYLDSALEKLNNLNESAKIIDNDFMRLREILQNTSEIINSSSATTEHLQASLLEMQKLYQDLGDSNAESELSKLLDNLQETQLKLKFIYQRQKNIDTSNVVALDLLRRTQISLNNEINSQDSLDYINNKTDTILQNLFFETESLKVNESAVNFEAVQLQKTIDLIKLKMEELNDTLAEEKKKKEFIEENFPAIENKYSALKFFIDDSKRIKEHVVDNVSGVDRDLASLKIRLDKIREIAIPLDLETKELKRMTEEVRQIKYNFRNVSDTYRNISLNSLKNRSASFEDLQSKYALLEDDIRDMTNQIKKIDVDTGALNTSAHVIKESIGDINGTIDDYISLGDKISQIFQGGDQFSSKLNTTNASALAIASEFNLLNNSLNNLLDNYSHIDDPNIIKAKETVQQLIKSSGLKIDFLKDNIAQLGESNQDKDKLVQEVNNTHTSTKKLLEELKKHIKQVGNMSNALNTSIGNLENQRENASLYASSLNPELQNIIDNIKNMTLLFMEEQEKLDTVAAHRPLFEKRFHDLKNSFAQTNEHISYTDVKLVDLKYNIKTVGSRLDKFKKLNISTDLEMKAWDEMSRNVTKQSKDFIALEKKYQDLNNMMSSVDDRSVSKEEMVKKFQQINETLQSIETSLGGINADLSGVEKNINQTDGTLTGLENTMEMFKVLQMDLDKTETTLSSTESKLSSLKQSAGRLTLVTTTTKDKLEQMKLTYDILNDSDWTKALPKFNKDLTNQTEDIIRVNKSIGTEEKNIQSTASLFKNIRNELETTSLTRYNADAIVNDLQKRLNVTLLELSNSEKPLQVSKTQVLNKQSKTNLTQSEVETMNNTLHRELLKFNYVKTNLPALQSKHSEVNKSYTANIPNMDNMKGQVANLVSIIDKIKEKMKLLGVEDNDNSIKNWDLAIQKLNSTVSAVLDKNKQAGDKLADLQAILRSNDSLYVRSEDLSDVKLRFEGYNKTLDEIRAASHTINVKLADLQSAAQDVVGKLMERDSILTTTPATTTPSGPPDWMTFKTTNIGVIGKDPGIAECAVEDLTQWQMMKITRVGKDGKEEAIAAWKVGSGARKAVRDTRIKVKRTVTDTGGMMTVGFDNLQCEDEGSYYCSIDTYNMWPIKSTIAIVSPPEDNLKPDFPTEVFEDKVANFSCTGHPGYPSGKIIWKIKRQTDADFQPYDFYSFKSKVSDTSCVRTETNQVEHQFEKPWNNTKIRCYIQNTDFFAEGIIRLLPYDICNKVRYLGTISHPYTPHKYIVCGKELNIMLCPGNTCYDQTEENCVQCKAGHGISTDPCVGLPLFSYAAHETDCTKYYICMGPTKTAKKCSKGYFAPNIPGNCVMSYAQSHCGRQEG